MNIQSPHPYPANYEETWIINANPSASRIRLHFNKLITEAAWDFVYIMDANDDIIEIYTAENYDLWTPWIPGNVAKIMLTSDDGNEDYGFWCDKYEVESIGNGLPGVCIKLSPDGRSTTTSADGLFIINDVDVGIHSVTPSLTGWSFDPETVSLNMSAGLEKQLFFNANMSQITCPSVAKLLADGTDLILKNVIVTAKYNGFFYVCGANRINGIRVNSSALVSEGSIIDVKGTIITVDGERRIIATNVTVH